MQKKKFIRTLKTYIDQSGGMGAGISCKWKPKQSRKWGSHTYVRQNRLQAKGANERHRRSLPNDKNSIIARR